MQDTAPKYQAPGTRSGVASREWCGTRPTSAISALRGAERRMPPANRAEFTCNSSTAATPGRTAAAEPLLPSLAAFLAPERQSRCLFPAY